MNTTEQKLINIEKRLNILERAVLVAPLQAGKRAKALSSKEFLIAHPGTGDVYVTFLLCCYAEQVLGMESFNIVDIEGLFRSAKMPMPTNLNDKINKNIAKGYLTEAKEKKDGKKAWVVTLSGEQAFSSAKAE